MRRVGGLRDRKIDVRILAATNRDLEREAQRGTFRKDLYFRLAVILLRLPPLRERGQDILLLADRFLTQFSAKYGRKIRDIAPAARELLLAYPWPGNVRELSHVIERGVLWSRGPTLAAEHLSLTAPSPEVEFQSERPAERPAERHNEEHKSEESDLDLPQWERSMIERALREAGGNQTRAAQRLGISRDTLRYRLKKFGIRE